MKIREAYEESLGREGHTRDPAQLAVIDHLEDLQNRLEAGQSATQGLRGLVNKLLGRHPAVRGLYVCGGVGRGKTFLMDLFYETLDVEARKRSHFHRIMQDVHRRLAELKGVDDPLDKVAANIARDTDVLCFDEFFVSDIGDAMILGRLLDGLFRRGVTLVATSNSRPDELYKGGLQRERFLPAIRLLEQHTEVITIGDGTDYRLRLLQQAGTFLHPDDADAHRRLTSFFDHSASSQIESEQDLDINGRDIRAYRCAKGVAWFRFDELCDGPRSQADYIELARWYPTIIVSGVPRFDALIEDQARRFIALVDEFYDRRVKLMLSARTDVHSLYAGRRLSFEFERTISRLVEMQSAEYLALPHLA
ncbi:MAG: AFG1 family ATPase [Gammaproteobacteria bacterium]|nr:AFG1 family ATPase [Gammaproteobacteria bacterium]